jgi:hypothetical protein
MHYVNLWQSTNKRRHHDNNVTFFIYYDLIKNIIKKTPRITTNIVETY